MEKYIFNQYSTSRYKTDPVFGTTNFCVFGNPATLYETPDLFEVYLNEKRRFRYCLVYPWSASGNRELLLKIKRYLIFHEQNDDVDKLVNTYFFGDLQKSIDVSNGFQNQNIILVTYEMIEQWYPKTMDDTLKIIVEQLSKRLKFPGQVNRLAYASDDELFVDPSLSDSEKRDYKLFLFSAMEKEGYASIIRDGITIDSYTLTSKAISLSQHTEKSENKIAFIAIRFGDNEERINVIQNAISEAGYEPRIMSQVETNNWIMPEIFYQIRNCRFVVADFSVRCDGAYYEAGYAAALDKPVIHLFDKRKENKNNKLHFDIAQKSTIFYKDYDDLRSRLINRIKATIK